MITKKKTIKYVAVLTCVIFLISGCGQTQQSTQTTVEDKEKNTPVLEKVTINSLGKSASGGTVKKVNWNCELKNNAKKQEIYTVETLNYSKKDLENLLHLTDGSKAELKEQSNEGGTVTYAGNTGSMIEHKTDTGYIQYSSKSLLEGSSSEPITRKKADSYYRKKAVEIAKMIGCKQNFDTVKPEVKVSEYMESVDNNGNIVREPVKFRVDYLQKEINDTKIDGNCPGVFVEFDASGEICSFTNIGRKIDVKKDVEESFLKDKKEVEKSIIEGKNASISELYDTNSEITITSCETVLYSDPANMKQENMIPYYRLLATVKGTGEKIDILLPALKDEMLEYRG